MKRILKRIGVLLLAFSIVMQSAGINAYATGNTGTLSGNNIDVTINAASEVDDIERVDEYMEMHEIVKWIEENIPEDRSELLEKPQEWWDSLTLQQKKMADIFAYQAEYEMTHYCDQPLEEVIEILEDGEIEIEEFFEQTVLQYMTMDYLYELQEMSMSLEELVTVIIDMMNGTMPEDDMIFEMAVMVSGYSPITTFGYTPSEGDQVAHMNLTQTGYTNGKGLPFWVIKNGGAYAFCLSHGSSCSSSYNYGNFTQVSGPSAYLVETYGPGMSTTEGYMALQMAIWAIEDGSTSSTVNAECYSYFLTGGLSDYNAKMLANSAEFYFNKAQGQSGSMWVAEGPAGSQPVGKTDPFITTTYTGGGGEGGGTDPGEPTPPPPPPAPDPEYDSVSDSVTVSYNVVVSKKDNKANVPLAGAVFDIYENGSKVATVTTGSDGTASWSTSRSDTDTEEYCTNYDELDDDGKAEVDARGAHTSKDSAEAEVASDLSDFANTTYTYSAKETKAPTGYYNDSPDSMVSETIRGNGTATLNFSDTEQLAEITIYKEGQVTVGTPIANGGVTYQYKNQKLAGAVYKVTAGADIYTAYGTKVYSKGDTVKSGLTTGSDGSVKLSNLHLGTYVIEETKAPTGYVLNTQKNTVKIDYAGQSIKVVYKDSTVTNNEQLAELTIKKEGEVLTGATVTSDGVTFKYEVKPLANAVYSVYAAEAIKTGYGKVVYNKGDLVKSGLTTNSNGEVKLSNLHIGKYTVKETKPPHGYILNNAEKTVTFTYGGQDVKMVYQSTTYTNTRQKAQVSLLKQDADTKKPLDGAVYGLYADSDIKDYKGNKIVNKGTLIEKVTTAANGKSTFKADIPIDLKYVVKEITAPYGYYNNESPYSFSFNYTNMNEAVVKFSNTFENDRVLGYVDLTKYDVESESDITQGNTENLEGAVYGIYAAEDIIHSDGATGVIHKKDDLVAKATIGESVKQNADGQLVNTDGTRHLKNPSGTLAYDTTPGQTRFGDLELGKYYIKELTPPYGYMLDDTIYEVTISYQGQNIKVVERDETAADDENGLTMDDANTGHDIHTGDYAIKQGVQFIKTSDDNYGTDLELIEGAGFSIYLITDLSGVQNGTLTPVNGTWGEEDVLTFYDYDFTGEPKAKLYKRSNETWTTGDTKWLKSLGGNLYEVKEMFTDEDGYIATPELPFGSYVIVETTTTDDHVSAKPFVVHISQDGGVLYTDATKQTVDKKYSEDDDLRYGDRKGTKAMEGRALQKQKVINNAVTESYLRVVKADEEFLVAPGTPVKPEEVVRGTVLKEDAKYLLQCLSVDKSKNSLLSLNWKIDADGYLTYYSPVLKGNLGTEDNPFTTSFLKKGGKIVDSYITLPQELPVGTYALIEVGAPDGYVLNGSEQKVNDTSAGRVNGYEIVDDAKTGLTFTISNGSVFPDGQMGTNKYALTDSNGNLIVTVLQKNQEQKGIIEIYKHGDQLASTEFSEEKIQFRYEDAPVEGAQFNIVAAEDIYTQELDKALLSQYGVNVDDYLIHSEGDVVATITTDCNGWGYASGLYIGKYKIVETVAGNGFVLNTTQEAFEITKQNQTVNFDIKASDYKNERQKIQLNVLKKDAEKATPLEGAVYALYAAEDIYTNIELDTVNDKWIVRDTPEVIVTADTLIATGITGADGKYQFDEDLPLGKYYIKELEAPLGYFNATDDIEVDATYAGSKGGQNVGTQLHNVVFENFITKTVITKLDLTNGKELAGAFLEVCEVQVDSGGMPVQKDGTYVTTRIESWISEENLHLIRGLHLEKLYLLRETKPADGYVTAEEILFKIVEKTDDAGKPMGIAAVHFYDGKQWIETGKNVLVMSDDVTKLEISKKDITTGKELPGAALEIYDEEGTMIHTWVSTDKPHYIEKLPIGKYTLVEKFAPKGYSRAESIVFEILDTGEVQKVEMFDDIWKVDVEKSAAEQVMPGDTLEYRIDTVKNCTEESLEKFTLTDVLPAEVCLMELWTGTYNQEGTYTVEYLTNLCEEWQVWEEGLTTKENHQLLPPEKLLENEFITAFRMNFGTVAGKFCNIESPKYQVLVPLNVTKELRNVITLSAIADGKPVSDQDETITRLEIPKKEETENKAPQKPKTPEEVKKTEPEQKETEIKIPDQVADTGDRNSIVQWAILVGMIGIGMITLKKKPKKSKKP